VPNSTLLAPRVFSGETLRKRLDYLRVIGAYPPDEPPLLVSAEAQASEHLETFAKAIITNAGPATAIVVVDLVRGRGSDELVQALASEVGERVYRLPEEVTLEDIAAAMANARAFVGGSVEGYVAALSFGVPAVLVSPTSPPPFNEALVVRHLAELPDALTALLRGDRGVDEATLNALAGALETHFDTLAAIAEESWSKRLSQKQAPHAAIAELGRALAETERRYEALLQAYAARGEQLLVERMRFSELLDATEAEDSTAARVRALLDAADARNRLEIIDAERAVVRTERDEARAVLDSVRAERDELRAQLAQASSNHRPARVLRLLARRG
jgi:hypothetical protein